MNALRPNMVVVFKIKIFQAKSYLKNYKNQLLENSRKESTLIFYRQNLGADLADIPLIRKIFKGIHFLFCVIDILCKYAQVIPLKDKRGITITNNFPKVLK